MIITLLLVALAAPLTVEDYVTMPTVSSPRFSPDGRRIAYVVNRADLERSASDTDVWLIDADGRNNVQLTRSPQPDYTPRWSPDGKWIAFLSDRDGPTALYLISPAGGEAMRLTDGRTGIRDYAWSPGGESIAFVRLDEKTADEERREAAKDDARVVGERSRHAHIHIVDVATKETRRLTGGDFTVWTFSWSPDGKRIAFARGPGSGLDDQFRTDIYIIGTGGGDPEPVVVREGLDRNPEFSPDGKRIAFTSTGGVRDWTREQMLHVVSLDDGSIRAVGAEYGRIPDSFTWSPDGRTIWFGGPLDATTQIFRVNADGTGTTHVTGARALVDDPDFHFGSGRMAFVYQSLDAPPEISISPMTRFEPRRLTDHNAAYRDRLLGRTQVVRWKNPKDGMEIEGFLTLPLGYERGRRAPLLTFVHGGPASRFDHGFLGYHGYIYPPHVFAARGYAVFRPNPRGTGGYGQAFRGANVGDWGGMDWLDINAGIDTLIEQGIADPGRLGLMGWSYGGYIASWALSQSDRFKAVSIGAPVVDLLSFHGTTDIRDFIPGYFPGRSLDEWRARSPLWHLRKTSTPVLIQHGESDDRVPLSQGTMLYRILDELGADVTMVIYPRTPHTPREPKLRLDVARRNLAFFAKHIPPGPSPPR
ncbi:MAG TPA: S9 family peptidase [Thermoanaerobaculia bacterium]|nr:S9 family peptidase [Thermoanaerobaculia bacterium]